MPKVAKELKALAVSKLSKPGTHAVGGVSGLALQISPSGSRSWILRATVGARRREIGLGGYPDVTLSQAQEKARALKADIQAGIDPVMARLEAASALRASQILEVTFLDAARRFIAAKSVEWQNTKHSAQWGSTLAKYAYPLIGSMMVRHVSRGHITEILEPIWTTKTETASRLRGRIEAILDWARVKGYRDEGTNPAAWRGNLDKILAAPNKAKRVRNHPALPIDEIPAFMAALRSTEGIGARCLEFTVLTAARSGEARAVTWNEIDLDKAVWTVPAEKMKAKKEHRVPLSPSALDLLRSVPTRAGVDLIFPSPRAGAKLSDMTLLAIMRRMKLDATPHGFRSTFRDWVGEHTAYPKELAEVALAHVRGDATEAAYWRGDVLEKRRQLMTDWAEFCLIQKA
ncbi:tyrosine-type recombinase/integrase [Pandoraea sp.]|uniref:tyrosine-type recombinase/integrase n=1 Tax=Pandoraea sp. TaxID=1883445 RepID=UPI0035B219F5